MAEGGVVVANPGPIRWMRPIASALADAGLLRAYVTTIGSHPRLEQVAPRFPRALAPVVRELAVRPMPPRVPAGAVSHTAAASELLRIAMLRGRAPERVLEGVSQVAYWQFDRGVRRRLRRDDQVLLGMYAASLLSFRHARRLGIRTMLDYPIAHHRFAEAMLGDEARRQPAWGPTLRLPTAFAPRLDAEIALADRIIVLSGFQRRTFVECGVAPEKLVQIPLGVDLQLFRPPAIRAAADGPFRVLFTGQLTQRKGIAYLIEGFERAALPEAKLTLVGRLVGNHAPWNGHPRVRHVPPVPHAELAAHYHDADVYVLPSLVEGFPQTTLEAMASGLPVIVSENTFGDDVVTDGVEGYVVPIRDPDAIAERLRHLHARPEERLRMGAAARRRAESFSWAQYGERVVGAVRALLTA